MITKIKFSYFHFFKSSEGCASVRMTGFDKIFTRAFVYKQKKINKNGK